MEILEVVERSPNTSFRRISHGVCVAGYKCGEHFTTLVSTFPRANCPDSTTNSLQCTRRIFATGSLETGSYTWTFYSPTRLRSTDAEWLIRIIHTSGRCIILTHPRKHFESRSPVNICWGITGSQVNGPYVLEERFTSSTASVSGRWAASVVRCSSPT